MSAALTLAALVQLASACPVSGVPLERIIATAQAESGLRPFAIHDNSSGQSFFLESRSDAVALAASLRTQGHRLDAGLMQVSDANWHRLGLTEQTVFDAGANVCAGAAVLAEAYAIERRVSCRYNTGRPDCSNGYPERIERAHAHLGQLPVISPAGALPADPDGWSASGDGEWHAGQPRAPADLPSPTPVSAMDATGARAVVVLSGLKGANH